MTLTREVVSDWPNVPTAKELGYGVVSTSPYGLVGPKGMELLAQLNQDVWYLNSEDYAKWARDTYAKEERLIEKLGLAAK